MKILKILLLIILISFVTIEFYWAIKYKGNLIIYIQNQTYSPSKKSIESVDVEILLNDEQIFLNNNLNYTLLPDNVSLIKNLGTSKITVKRIDNNTIKNERVFHFLITWIIIDIYSDKIIINKELIPPLFQ